MAIDIDCPECDDGEIEMEKIDDDMKYSCTECDYAVDSDEVGREFGLP